MRNTPGRLFEQAGCSNPVAVDGATQPEELEAGLRRVLLALAAASHSALLGAICKFLTGLQITMARQIAGGSAQTWTRTVVRLADDRRNLVEAIAKSDAAEARSLALAYHRRAAQVITSVLTR